MAGRTSARTPERAGTISEESRSADARNSQAPAPKVVVVGIDGVRYDTLLDVSTAALDRIAGAGFLRRLRVNDAGITSTRAADADAATLAVADWPPLSTATAGWPMLVGAESPVDKPPHSADAWNVADDEATRRTAAFVTAVRSDQQAAAFCYLGLPDAVCHDVGVTDEYRKAIEASDRRLAAIDDAITSRENTALNAHRGDRPRAHRRRPARGRERRRTHCLDRGPRAWPAARRRASRPGTGRRCRPCSGCVGVRPREARPVREAVPLACMSTRRPGPEAVQPAAGGGKTLVRGCSARVPDPDPWPSGYGSAAGWARRRRSPRRRPWRRCVPRYACPSE